MKLGKQSVSSPTLPKKIVLPEGEHNVFVFGSNLAGQHLGGAARFAYENYGARWGKSIGLAGRSYAIPTMDENLQPLSIFAIQHAVGQFLDAAHRMYPHKTFYLTPIGCGIAGFEVWQIKALFPYRPENVIFPEEFL